MRVCVRVLCCVTTLLSLLLLLLPQAVDGKADRKMEMRFIFRPWCEAT